LIIVFLFFYFQDINSTTCIHKITPMDISNDITNIFIDAILTNGTSNIYIYIYYLLFIIIYFKIIDIKINFYN